jgi:hypothetical protein
MQAKDTISLEEIDDVGEILTEIEESRELDQSVSPELTAGDLEAAGGNHPTPDQDVADDIGKAAGITYQEGEPLRVGDKEHDRDVHRWELDPASAEDYVERGHERPAEVVEILKMHHEHRQRHSHRREA